MTGNNPNIDPVNINAYIKFGEILSSRSQDIERERNFDVNQGPQPKMTGNNPSKDLYNMNACIEFGKILSICSQDIERKRNSGVN